MKYSIIITAMALLFLTACATGRVEEKKEDYEEEIEQPEPEEAYAPDLQVDIQKLYSWANLMPGPDTNHRFHITGKVNVPSSGQFSLSALDLQIINIFQDGELIFAIKPTVREENAKSERYKALLFSTITGLTIGPNLNLDEGIDVELIFSDGIENYSYKVFDHTIEKTY